MRESRKAEDIFLEFALDSLCVLRLIYLIRMLRQIVFSLPQLLGYRFSTASRVIVHTGMLRMSHLHA